MGNETCVVKGCGFREIKRTLLFIVYHRVLLEENNGYKLSYSQEKKGLYLVLKRSSIRQLSVDYILVVSVTMVDYLKKKQRRHPSSPVMMRNGHLQQKSRKWQVLIRATFHDRPSPLTFTPRFCFDVRNKNAWNEMSNKLWKSMKGGVDLQTWKTLRLGTLEKS